MDKANNGQIMDNADKDEETQQNKAGVRFQSVVEERAIEEVPFEDTASVISVLRDDDSSPDQDSEQQSENIPSEGEEEPQANVEDAEEGNQLDEENVEEVGHEEEVPTKSIFETLDAPRVLLPPVEITEARIKQIEKELGLIRLCWPDKEDISYENVFHSVPASYRVNNSKEKYILLQAENFRRQFRHRYRGRKPLLLIADNAAGQQKMVCTAIRPTTVPHPEIQTWQAIASFVADHLVYEPLVNPIVIPIRLLSPHTIFAKQKGHSYEIANVLTSILLGLSYGAYMVHGYATRDVTMKIMTRVSSPYPFQSEEVKAEEKEAEVSKYELKPPKDLRSKFLLEMAQREVDKANAEKARLAAIKQKEIEEREKPPFDELEGQRLHGWVLLLPGLRDIKEPFFLEASTGMAHPLNSPQFTGIEAVWNNLNYWVNLQDCSQGLDKLDFDLTNLDNWEHFLIGEPVHMRKSKIDKDAIDDEDEQLDPVFEEKHLDMPTPWSLKIHLPHEVLKRRHPTGMKKTFYKYTLVEEFGNFVQEDGLVTRICRYNDLECSPGELISTEERYLNRTDQLNKKIEILETGNITEYFNRGREDAAKVHEYNKNRNEVEAERKIEFYHKSRFDGLSKIDHHPEHMTEDYINREDYFTYRHTDYAKRGFPPPGYLEGPRRIVTNIVQRFDRDPTLRASDNVATREFALLDREIHIKFHYDTDRVTASTRDFIKPPVTEMGDRLTFNPQLTNGYQAEVGSKPPKQSTLFRLLEKELKEEEECMTQIREIDDQITEFVRIRDIERAMPKLLIPLFDREQNVEFRNGMLARERTERESRAKEVEQDVDYLAPYLAMIHNPPKLHTNQAIAVRDRCLNDFKHLLLNRAIDLQKQFEEKVQELHNKSLWYTSVVDTLNLKEEEEYFEYMNDGKFWLNTLEMRLTRHKDLSGPRYEALVNYLKLHPKLIFLYKAKK